MDYIICSLFWSCFVIFLYLLGNSFASSDEENSVKFILGYLYYSFFVAIGGIVIQILNLSWSIFSIYMTLLLFGVCIAIFISSKHKLNLNKNVFSFFKECWFTIFLCLILGAMLFFYYRSFWYGNHLDDGYYITKVATLPYESSGFNTNYSVGIEQKSEFSYLLNTWELEASFFVKILGVSPTLYLRLFQSVFNYFVFFNCFLAFGQRLVKNLKRQYLLDNLKYSMGVCLVFFVYYVYLMDSKILFLRDMFHLDTGMYFGASIAKITVVLLLLMFYIQEEKIVVPMMMGVVAISIVLISKSSIVLPVIVLIIISSSIVWLYEGNGKKSKYFAVFLGGCCVIFGVALPGNTEMQKEVFNYVVLTIKSPIVLVCLVSFVLSFRLKEKIINRLNYILIITGLLMIVPELNDLFELCSVYDFVAGRAWSMYVYAFVSICVIYWYLLLCSWLESKRVRAFFAGITCIMIFLLVFGYKTDGKELFVTDDMPANTNLIEDIKVLYHNNKFIPNSTIALGESLQNLGDITGEKLYVLSPQWASIDGTYHSLATQIRTFAPDIVSVSASERYGVSEDSFLYGYDQSKYDNFIENPIEKNMNELKEEVEQYGINCIIVQNEECAKQLIEMGFEQVDEIQNGVYYVWYKKSE